MKICEILVDDGINANQELAGRFKLDNGKVTILDQNPKYKTLIAGIFTDKHRVLGSRVPVSVDSDPVAWFTSLPKNYSGSRLRARMV